MKAYLVFSKITALVFFVIFILFIPHFKEKTINNNLEENVLKNQELEKYYNFKKNFGNDRVMIAAFSFKNKNAGILKILFEIENKLLETGSAERIFSPLTILKDVFCIKEKKDFLNWCSDPVRVNNYYALFDKFSTLQKSILSKDGLTAAMIIYLSDTIKDTDISNIDEIKKIVLQSKLENVKITGIPDIVKVIHEYTLFSQKYFTPITIALILGVLFLLYGSLKIILIALFSIIMPLVITMGLFNYLGNSTNFIISMIPPLILGVALTSCIHILTDYFIRSRQAGIFSADLLKETIKEQYIPILLCQLTTFCGFASLAANGLGAIKQYGIYSALSIIFSCFNSLCSSCAYSDMQTYKPEGNSFSTGGPFF
jgi:predicted RND superfamily exporter protein